MKLLFLTTSTQPGRSGLGDYALALASELAGQGQEIAVIGLAEEAGGAPPAASFPFRTLSLSAALPRAERWTACRAFCHDLQPDWISLQFVSYAFDPRGWVWNLGARLREIDSRAAWQVMFHEIWIGAKQGAPLKERLLGLAQRASIRHAFNALRPRCAHTSNPVYQELLRRAGITAGILPLFGNIPLAPPSDDEALPALLASHGLDPHDTAARSKQLWIGLFGSLHPVWPPEPFFAYLEKARALSGRRPILISAGRLGPGRGLWERLRRDYGARCTFVELGEQPAHMVSRLFQQLDCGIATTPYQVIGKSGSAAAMAEHGLPVIVNRTERYGLPADDQPHPEPLYLPMTPELPRLLAQLPPRRPARSRLPEAARAFLSALGQA